MRRVALLLALAACSASFASASDEEVHQSLVRLREVGGWKPTGIIDIGAHEADWSRGAQKVFPDAKYLLLEGDSDLEPRLKAFGKPYEIAIVGARDGKVTWHQHEKWKTGNSIYLENTNIFHDEGGSVRKVERNMRTLDTIIAERGENVKYNLLKCDVQGAELDVIRGAKKTLEGIEVVILEVSIINYNQGAPRASRVVSSMYLRGFDLLDVVEQHYWDMPGNVRVLGQIDLMFARRDSPLFDAYGRAMNLLVGRKASHHRRVGRRAARRALAGLLP